MGQYWICVNLSRREFVHPHRLGCGLRLWEQLANHPGTGTALIILCAAMPEARGGGDFDLDDNWHGPERTAEYNITPGPMPEGYPEIAARTIGRWAGDRVALVGDYAVTGDLPAEYDAGLIYRLCSGKEGIESAASHWEKCEWSDDPDTRQHYMEKAHRLRAATPYTDITDDVCAVIEHELCGKFVGDGRREFKYNDNDEVE